MMCDKVRTECREYNGNMEDNANNIGRKIDGRKPSELEIKKEY